MIYRGHAALDRNYRGLTTVYRPNRIGVCELGSILTFDSLVCQCGIPLLVCVYIRLKARHLGEL